MFQGDENLKKSLQGVYSCDLVSTITFTNHFKAPNLSSVILPTGMTKSGCLKRQLLSLLMARYLLSSQMLEFTARMKSLHMPAMENYPKSRILLLSMLISSVRYIPRSLHRITSSSRTDNSRPSHKKIPA